MRIEIEGSAIRDFATFHDVFERAFGFPEFYGRNMDAWIDCMRYLRQPGAEMVNVHLVGDQVLELVIQNGQRLRERAPAVWRELVECTAHVNEDCRRRGERDAIRLVDHL